MGYTLMWRLTFFLVHISEGRCLERKTKQRSLFHSLHQWGTRKKMKASKQRHDSTSCHIHSLPSTVLPKTRTTVRIRPNLDLVRLLSTQDLGPVLPHFQRNWVMVRRAPWSPRSQFRDRGLSRSTRLTLVRLPVHITTMIHSRGKGTDQSVISPDT